MATAQQIQFAETIRAMKVAMKRRPDDSDSEGPAHTHTNRGHKLQRRAQFVRAGRLDDTGGLQAYKRKIQHAGYTRTVISLNPARYDVDGDPWSPTESDIENERAPPDGVEPVVDDPFADVRIEEVLRPLTNPAELPRHPGLRVAYTSPALSQMAGEALEMMRAERETLWKAKSLLLRFRGDGDWLPCGRFEGDSDETLLDNEEDAYNGDASAVGNGDSAYDGEREGMEGVEMESVVPPLLGGEGSSRNTPAAALAKNEEQNTAGQTDGMGDDATAQEKAIDVAALENPAVVGIRDRSRDPDAASEHTSVSGRETNGTNAPSHSMTTRARARSPVASDPPSPTPSDSASVPAINPWFLTPSSALPDRDFGLANSVAEDIRRLLVQYVQKQENIVRSMESLYNGLQRTDRLRHEVFRACKAEGHLKDDGKGELVTEMSDGEDWYDLEEWGLQPCELKLGKDGTLGLEKGKDEIEDVEEEGRRGAPRRRRVNRM